MKSYLALVILFQYISEFLSRSCKGFNKKCIDETSSTHFCYLAGYEGTDENSNFTYYYGSCPKGQFCQKITTYTGTCAKRLSLGQLGDECKNSFECESGVCLQNKCSYLKEGSVCNEDKNCNKTSFCYSGATGVSVCKPLSKEGEECNFDNYCAFNLACGTIDTSGKKKCAKMYSIKAGEMSDNAELCEGGYFVTLNSKSICADATTTVTNCNFEDENPCPMELDGGALGKLETGFGMCNCKWNGEQVCKPTSNSEQWKNFTKIYKEEVEKMKGEEVHAATMRRYFWGNKKIQDARTIYGDYLNIDGAPDCVVNYYLQQNSGNLLKLSLISFILAVMLL